MIRLQTRVRLLDQRIPHGSEQPPWQGVWSRLSDTQLDHLAAINTRYLNRGLKGLTDTDLDDLLDLYHQAGGTV